MGEKAAEDAPHHRWNENQTAGRAFLRSVAFLDNLLRPGPVTKLLQLSLSSLLFFFFSFSHFHLILFDLTFLFFLFFSFFCVCYLLVFQACTHLTNPFRTFFFPFFILSFKFSPHARDRNYAHMDYYYCWWWESVVISSAIIGALNVAAVIIFSWAICCLPFLPSRQKSNEKKKKARV